MLKKLLSAGAVAVGAFALLNMKREGKMNENIQQKSVSHSRINQRVRSIPPHLSEPTYSPPPKTVNRIR